MEVTNEIKNICSDLLERYKKQLNNNKATGNLENTATYQIKFGESWLELWFNLQDYWKYVENGRKAGRFPPISKIEDWIRVKPIVPHSINGKLPTTRQLAYLISRSIAENGTKAYKPLQKTVDSATDLFDTLCNEIIKQLENDLNKEIEEI